MIEKFLPIDNAPLYIRLNNFNETKIGPDGRTYRLIGLGEKQYNLLSRIWLFAKTLVKVIGTIGFFCTSERIKNEWEIIKTGKKITKYYLPITGQKPKNVQPINTITPLNLSNGIQDSELFFYSSSHSDIWEKLNLSEEVKKSFPSANYYIYYTIGTRNPSLQMIENEANFKKFKEASKENGLPSYCIALTYYEAQKDPNPTGKTLGYLTYDFLHNSQFTIDEKRHFTRIQEFKKNLN